MSEPHVTAESRPPGLRRDAIGLREVLFQSITDMAPGAAIAASIPAGAAYAGGALPLAVLFALIACLLSAASSGALAGPLRRAGPAPGHRVPGRLGLRAGGGADPAAGPAPARLHHRLHHQLRVAQLPGQPVVAVGPAGRDHRAGRGLVRGADLGPAGHGAGSVRDRGVRGPGRIPD